MKIAIIGWGSLVWDPRELPLKGVWNTGGPDLPIEFSRISTDGRLTLVIDNDNGRPVRTMHIPSARTALSDAIEDLRHREGTLAKNIGWVDLPHNTDSKIDHNHQTSVHHAVKKWCRGTTYDGAVWTALRTNFKAKTDVDFSVVSAVSYIKHLPTDVRTEALEYIQNAPKCVNTPVRQQIINELGHDIL